MRNLRLAMSAILIVAGMLQTGQPALAGAPSASSDNWLGGTGNWSNAANWSAGVPNSSAAVSIGNTLSGSVTEDLTNAAAASLSILNGNALFIRGQDALTVGGATSVANGGGLRVGDESPGGGTFTTGWYSNSGYLLVGDGGEMATASTVNVKGNYTSSGTGSAVVGGSQSEAANALLNISGAAPTTLTGSYQLFGFLGSATVKFGSGAVTKIGDGSTNPGLLTIYGPNAYFEVGATNSNSAVTGLSTIANNGGFDLYAGATLATNTGLNNAGNLGVDANYAGGSKLTIGGSLVNSGALQVGNANMTLPANMTVKGILTNTGQVTMDGGPASGANALLNITGAAPSTLTGGYLLFGSTGSAAIEFGSGGITKIGDGGAHSGFLLLYGPKSYLEIGTTNSNSALAGLSTISNNGNLTLEAGSAVATKTGLSNAGILSVDGGGPGGSTLTIGGALTNSNLAGSGNIQTSSPSTLNINGNVTNTNTGALNVSGGFSSSTANALLNVSGTSIANSGTINLTASKGNATLQIGSSTALTGAGVVTMSNNANNYIKGVTGSDVLTSSNTIEGAGNICDGLMGLVNQGTILANQSTELIIHPSSAGFNNKGALTVNAGSTLDVTGPANSFLNFNSGAGTLTGGTYNVTGKFQFDDAKIVTNAARITLTGSAAQILNQSNANSLGSFATNAAAGSFTLASTQKLTTSGGSFTNAGAMDIGSGSTFTVGNGGVTSIAVNYTQTAGSTQVYGTLASTTSASTPTLTISGGSLDGSGNLTYTVVDSASLAPGDSSSNTAALKVTGRYTQTSSGVLNIAIGGKTAGSQYDQLNISGGAALNGSLNLSLINHFVPSVGTTFDILNSSALSGTFAKVNGASINSNEHFAVSYNGKDVILTVASGAASSPAGAGVHPLYPGSGLNRFYRVDRPAIPVIASNRFLPSTAIATPRFAPSTIPAFRSGHSSAAFMPNHNRFGYGLNLLSFFGTSPKHLMKSFVTQQGLPDAPAFVSFSGSH
jgi:hypothetical protein